MVNNINAAATTKACQFCGADVPAANVAGCAPCVAYNTNLFFEKRPWLKGQRLSLKMQYPITRKAA